MQFRYRVLGKSRLVDCSGIRFALSSNDNREKFSYFSVFQPSCSSLTVSCCATIFVLSISGSDIDIENLYSPQMVELRNNK